MVATLAKLAPGASWEERYTALTGAMAGPLAALDALAQEHAAASGVRFAGFDSSAAPSKDTKSMADVCAGLGLGHFGAAGTVSCASFLTRVFKSVGRAAGGSLDLVGFSGFMLAWVIALRHLSLCEEPAALACLLACTGFFTRTTCCKMCRSSHRSHVTTTRSHCARTPVRGFSAQLP